MPQPQRHHLPRKRFGQHFLTDEAAIAAIVRAIDPRSQNHLVEIGPGLGALTHPLRDHNVQSLTLIELDRDLAAHWKTQKNLNVIEADVLNVDISALAHSLGGPLRIVGNLPYNVSTPILFMLLQHADHIVDQHFMLQKEVVQRMAAPPGSKTYGRLSVMLQSRYDIDALFDIGPEAFDPPPKVDSSVVRMTPLAQPPLVDRVLLSDIVTTAFSQRRKILRNTLGAWLDNHGFEGAFDLQRRAEEVSVAEFITLAQGISKRNHT